MSDQDGGDRPRWEGFPGGVDPVDPLNPASPYGSSADQPTGPVPGWEPAVPPGPAVPVEPAAPAVPVEPADPAAAAEPTPPQFPVQPLVDETAPIPVVVGSTPIDSEGSGLGPRRSRTHAAPQPDTSRYVAIACAAAVVLVGIGFLFVACNNDDATSSGNAAPVVPATGESRSATPSATPTRSASASTSTKPSTSPSARPSSSSSATGEAEPSPKASATATAAAKKQPVVVLNSTAITGLAKRVAADVERGGWTVTKTTNWRGAQPSVTTIYYLPGAKNKASAELFAKKFDVAQAVKPALPGMTSNLTLVLTRDAS
jgi:hypothetical protein